MFRRKKKVELPLRQHYRRRPGKQHGISIGVVRSDDKRFNGAILDLSAGGAALCFGEKAEPGLKIDDEVVLHFTVLSRNAEFTVVGKTTWVQGRGVGDVSIGFRFMESENKLANLELYFRNFFNRRQFPRVRPDLSRAIPVTVETEDVSFKAELRNVSLGGAVFLVKGEELPSFVQDAGISISLELPRQPNPVETEAVICHSKVVPKGVLLGVRFIPAVAKKFRADRDRLNAYIEQRLREIEAYNAA